MVHHALCNVIAPLFERKFIDDSYANRIGKGTHKALDRCTHFMRRYPYVLHCDIQQFFPSIDHLVLKSILSRVLACQPTLRLCKKIIDSGDGILRDEYDMRWFPGDDLFALLRPRGLPIGNLTSQFWANVYLNDLDHFIKRQLKCPAYIRYVDDFVLFADDKIMLNQWRAAIISFLQSYRLTIHERPAQVRPTASGLPFLGFTVYPDHRRLKPSRGLRYRRRLAALYAAYQRGEIPAETVISSLRAWHGHVRHGDTWALQATLLGQILT